MSQPDPEIEPADLEERIYQGLRRACDGALLSEPRLVRSKYSGLELCDELCGWPWTWRTTSFLVKQAKAAKGAAPPA